MGFDTIEIILVIILLIKLFNLPKYNWGIFLELSKYLAVTNFSLQNFYTKFALQGWLGKVFKVFRGKRGVIHYYQDRFIA